MSVYVTAIGALMGTDAVEFNARKDLPNRKHLKMMTRDVRLGVGAVVRAIEVCGNFENHPPPRRGLYVGGAPTAADPSDLARAVGNSLVDGQFDAAQFGETGIVCVPPLWLVKGLSNNIMGFATHYFDVQGHNVNRCDGRWGSVASIVDGMHALNEGRVDIAIVGGADSLVAAEPWIGRAVSEAGVFFVLERDSRNAIARVIDGRIFGNGSPVSVDVDCGAATGGVAVLAALQSLTEQTTITMTDILGAGASVTLAPV